MFQSFDVTSTPQFGRERVAGLRASFDALGIDAFLIPRADEYQGEYVPACSERLAWLTGFTGSAGVALVTRSQAIVFVDGRYTTQLVEQVDQTVFTGGDLVNEAPHIWIPQHAPKGLRLGVDPWLHTGAEVRRLEKALADIGGTLVFLPHNPLDRLWSDRPGEPLGAVIIQAVAQQAFSQPRRSRQSRIDSRRRTLRRCWSPIRLPSPGYSTSAAATCRTRLIRWRAPLSMRMARPSFSRQTQDQYRGGGLSGADLRQLSPSGDLQAGSDLAGGGRILVDPDLAPMR